MKIKVSLWYLITSTVLCVHVYSLTKIYLCYNVDTKVAPHVPFRQKMPKMSLCFSLNSLLNKKIESLYFEREMPQYFDQTAKELFAGVPPVDEVLKKCAFRNFELDVLLKEDNSTNCARIFNIRRYRMQGYMCYLLSFNRTSSYSFYSVTHSLHHQRRLFSLTVNRPLDDGHAVYPLIHFSDFPYDDRIFNQELICSHKYKYTFHLSYDLFEITRLKYPYATNCAEVSAFECYEKCWDKIFRQKGLSPMKSIMEEDERFDQLVIPPFMQHSKNVMQSIFGPGNQCRDKCQSESCFQSLVKTHTPEPFLSPELNFFAETARHPIMKIMYKPSQQLMDYLTQIFSLAGILIDFSVLILFCIKQQDHGPYMNQIYLMNAKVSQMIWIIRRRSVFRGHRFARKCPIDPIEVIVKDGPKLADFLFKSLTLSAFLWQMVNICSNYFSYATKLNFEYGVDPEFKVPSLILCFKVKDIFNITIKDNLTESNYHQIFTGLDRKMNFSMKEIFESPFERKLLSKCRLRNNSDYLMRFNKVPLGECVKIFKLSKFYSSGQLCYQFVANNTIDIIRRRNSKVPPYKQSYIRREMINPGIIYSLILGREVSKFKTFKVISFPGSRRPFLSKEFAAWSSKTKFKRLQFVSYQLRKVTQLPPPYDTGCSSSNVFCRMSCYNESVRKLNRLSNGEVSIEPLPVKIISYSDLVQPEVNEYWRGLEQKCFRKCRFKTACAFQYTQTYISYAMDRTDESVELAADIANNPTAIVSASARTTLFDFYYQIFCSLSFWLGLSILSLNPFKVRRKFLLFNLNRKLNRHIFHFVERVNSLSQLVGLKRLSFFTGLQHVTFNSKQLFAFTLCFLGCLCHLVYASKNYLEYQTILETHQKTETGLNFSVSLCIDVTNSETKARSKYSPLTSEYYIETDKYFNLTADDLWTRGPIIDKLLSTCRYWGPTNDSVNDLSKASDRLMMRSVDASNCNSLFLVKKFIFSGKLCFRINTKRRNEWNRDQMMNAFNNLKNLFAVSVNTSIVSHHFSVVVTPENSYPRFSALWAPLLTKSTSNNARYGVSYIKYHQIVLPPPYSLDGFGDCLSFICLEKCINDFLLEKNFVSLGLIKRPSKGMFVKYLDRVDPGTRFFIKDAEAKCEQICLKTNLAAKIPEETYTITQIHEMKTSGRANEHSTSFYLSSTDYPVVSIEFKEKFSLFEFIVEVGSIFGTWFGLSVMDVNIFNRNSLSYHQFSSLMNRIKKIQVIFNRINKPRSQSHSKL